MAIPKLTIGNQKCSLKRETHRIQAIENKYLIWIKGCSDKIGNWVKKN